jgi:bifunctional UDP-N-acetylglucosamine pyrophosphorylase/glucosamine-1-phosphate N-acetyltransferase
MVVVLAAGKGVRMRSRIPKVLHPVAGRPMLLWAIAAARPLAPQRTLVVTNPRHDGVQAALNGEGETVSQAEQLGTGHAVAQVAPAHRSDGPVLVIYGDMPLLRPETLRRLVETHRERGPAASVLTSVVDDPTGYGRIVRGRNGLVRAIVEEKDATPEQRQIKEINSGAICFSGRELWPALARLESRNQAAEFYLTGVVSLLKGKIETVAAADPSEVLGINDRVQLAEAESILRRRIMEDLMRAGVTITDPATTYIDADVKIGPDSTVHPFSTITGSSLIGEDCVIGPFAQVRDTTIGDGCRVERAHLERARLGRKVVVGPFSRLRPGAELEDGVRVGTHAEIKNSRLGSGTQVGHFSYIGDTSIGVDANIGAGTVTANWDGFQHQQTVIGDRAQIGSDTILVAPVTVGSDVYTGAGSVITRDVPAGSLAIERTEQKIVPQWTQRYRARKRPAPATSEGERP